MINWHIVRLLTATDLFTFSDGPFVHLTMQQYICTVGPQPCLDRFTNQQSVRNWPFAPLWPLHQKNAHILVEGRLVEYILFFCRSRLVLGAACYILKFTFYILLFIYHVVCNTRGTYQGMYEMVIYRPNQTKTNCHFHLNLKASFLDTESLQ